MWLIPLGATFGCTLGLFVSWIYLNRSTPGRLSSDVDNLNRRLKDMEGGVQNLLAQWNTFRSEINALHDSALDQLQAAEDKRRRAQGAEARQKRKEKEEAADGPESPRELPSDPVALRRWARGQGFDV